MLILLGKTENGIISFMQASNSNLVAGLETQLQVASLVCFQIFSCVHIRGHNRLIIRPFP